MTAERFAYNVNKNCIECDGKFVAYLDSVDGFRIANKLTVLAEENEQLRHRLAEREKMLDIRDKIIADVSKALWGNLE